MNNVNNKNIQHIRVARSNEKHMAVKDNARWTCANQSGEIDPDYVRYQKIFYKDSKLIEMHDFAVHLFHNWFDNLQTKRKSLSIEYEGNRYRHRIRFERRRGDKRELVSVIGNGKDKKEQLYDIIRQLNGVVVFQMDGEGNAEAVAASNTEILLNEEDKNSGSQEVGPEVENLCNTEQDYS